MKTIQEIPSLIGTLQSNKILQKMKVRKDNGEFRTEVEYNAELKNQLIAITKLESQPTFNFTQIVSGRAHSDYINLAMDQVSLDLEVVFAEISYMFSKIESHRAFFEKTTKEVETLVNKLERQLESMEIEAGLDSIFNRVQYDSFLNKSKRLSLLHPLSSEFYYDRRELEKVTESELGNINTEVGRLSLPVFSELKVEIADINIVSTQTTVSDFNVQLPGVTSQNLLSTDESSIWSYNILTRKKMKEATLVLEVDMGDKKEVNKLRIVPNAVVPVLLESISYSNENGEDIDLNIGSQPLSESKLFSFATVIARRFKVTLKQDRNKLIPFDLNSTEVTLDDLARDPSLPISIRSISGNVATQINDPNIQNILGIVQETIEDPILLNNYVFSLNSIEAGLSDYRVKGMYNSTPIKINSPTIIGLEKKDNIDKVIDIQTQLEMPAGSIEYSLSKKDYNADGLLIKTETFEILPLGQDLIDNERLFFGKDKIQRLRFLAHKSDGDGSLIKLFRNGEELILGVDWKFADRQTPGNPGDTLVDLTVGSTKIEILHTDEQILNGIYYSEYSPRYRLEPENTVFDKNVRYLETGATLHALSHFGEEINYSDIYMNVVIRNHTNSGISSPYVDFYRLVVKEELDE